MGDKLLNRQWRLQVTNQQNQLKTTIEINPKSLHLQPKKGETFWLVVNPKGETNFQSDQLKYHPISDKSTKEKIVFDHVVWDNDQSGSDKFTLAIGPKILRELSPEELAALRTEKAEIVDGIPQFDVYLNPSIDGSFQVKIRPHNLDKITLSIHNALGQEIIRQNFAGSDYYFYENRLINKGIYLLSVVENERAYSRKLIVE